MFLSLRLFSQLCRYLQCIYLMLFYLPETNDQTAVVAGGVGGTLALVILILIIVFLVHRRYTFVCIISKVSYVCTFKKIHITFYIETLGQSIREYVLTRGRHVYVYNSLFFITDFEKRNR